MKATLFLPEVPAWSQALGLALKRQQLQHRCSLPWEAKSMEKSRASTTNHEHMCLNNTIANVMRAEGSGVN